MISMAVYTGLSSNIADISKITCLKGQVSSNDWNIVNFGIFFCYVAFDGVQQL